ncbi:MAG: hypothetical protein K2Y09_01590 [Nitrosomonas sp.]|uniref:hypothetical protein n=1 Tax=Nitrosomonas sp. TaxID=42353 RepID=UPI001DA534C9|nr:hypothetical protein [Nitrosomonas sp.]MBX9893863.1 hypothetical protein [Nitrosomonas sp.]
METPNDEKHAVGRSGLSVGLCLLLKVKKMRDETALTCEDMVLSDGTVMFSNEQGLAIVAQYDECSARLNINAVLLQLIPNVHLLVVSISHAVCERNKNIIILYAAF